MSLIAERQRQGEAIDLARETEALRRSGYAFPTALTLRILRVGGVVEAAGWDAARDLCRETFVGWEVEALGQGLAMIRGASEDARADRQAAAMLRGLGGSPGG